MALLELNSIKRSTGLGMSNNTLTGLNYTISLGMGRGNSIHNSRIFYIWNSALSGSGVSDIILSSLVNILTQYESSGEGLTNIMPLNIILEYVQGNGESYVMHKSFVQVLSEIIAGEGKGKLDLDSNVLVLNEVIGEGEGVSDFFGTPYLLIKYIRLKAKKVKQNFEIYSGNNVTIIYDVEGIDKNTLENAHITWKLALNVNGGPLVIKKSNNPSEIIIKDTQFKIELKPEDTKDLKENINYYHEAEIIDDSNQISTIATGRMRLKPTLIKGVM